MTSSPELIRDAIGWDIVTWSRAIPFWQHHLGSDLSGMKALEIGAGNHNGGISLWLASLGAEVVSSNYEEVSLTVKQFHRKHGVQERIRYEKLDAKTLPYRDSFDVVAFKSVLGRIGAAGISEEQRAVTRFVEALREGGTLIFAENLSGTRVHAMLRSRFGAGKRGWRYPGLSEIHSLLAPFDGLDVMTTGFLAAFGPAEWQKSVLGRIDSVLEPLIPESWRYVVIGVARKKKLEARV
jgi:SAM-dependent methyltransferase